MNNDNIDVKFYETFREEEKLIADLLPDEIKAEFANTTIQESGDEKLPARLISIRTQSIIPESWTPDLEGILTRSQGYDHLLHFKDSPKNTVTCGYLDVYCARSVAEHAITCALWLIKNLGKQTKQFTTFNREGLTVQQWAQKKALVIGVGNIGNEIVKLAEAMGFAVKGVDVDPREKEVEYVSLQDGIDWADYIFCAAELNAETNGMLGYDRLKGSSNKPMIINVSRGEITPLKDMIQLLDREIIAGLALDVYENEAELSKALREGDSKRPQMVQNLAKRENVICTPHNAFNTEQAIVLKAEKTVKAIAEFLQNKRFPFQI